MGRVAVRECFASGPRVGDNLCDVFLSLAGGTQETSSCHRRDSVLQSQLEERQRRVVDLGLVQPLGGRERLSKHSTRFAGGSSLAVTS